MSAVKAEKLGYKNVKVFHAGLPAWKKEGNLVASNVAGLENFVKTDASYILIDLRPTAQAKEGHIAKAVTVPAGGIEAMKDQFPAHKAAPIILYNQDGSLANAEKDFKTITGWGYTNVSVLSGGLQAWEKAKQALAKGPAAEKISYVRKLRPGEFDVEAFKLLVGKPTPADIFLLDVRNASEAKEGLLPSAKNVPLEELEQRLSDIPKDKKLLIHCSTGVRAEMAYNILKKAGYDPQYVKAKVDFDKEKKGEFKITE
jgi:rhodanese-related sulfurtransferase